MSDKYIKVSDLIDCLGDIIAPHHVAYKGFHKLQTTAQEMVSVDDMRDIVANLKKQCTSLNINEFEDLINTQPEKFGSFIIIEWEQLDELPYISISVNGINGDEIMFLADYQGDYDDGIKLLSDPGNMTRTDTNIPDGIRIEVTFIDESSEILITPLSKEFSIMNNMKHYRILGASDE